MICRFCKTKLDANIIEIASFFIKNKIAKFASWIYDD